MTPQTVSLKAADAQPSPSVKLALDGTAAYEVQAQWVMVAKEGIFLGYNGGENPFQFTRETFDQIVANVRTHPSFVANAEGVGTTGVVPWDFDHASEQGSTTGSLPTTGAPAQAWTFDAEVRDGAQGAELWALTQFLETAREYVRNGQYQWASVAVSFESVHPRTGQNVGAMMSSIALTNTPFIEGMDKLVASRTHRVMGYRRGPAPEKVELRGWYEAAESPMDAVRMLKELFGQSETDGIDEVFGELNKVAAYVVNGAPLGVDVDHLVSCIRKILNLAALLPETEVVATAIAQLQSIIENQPNELAPNQEAPPAAPPTDNAAFTAAKETQDMEAFIKTLASKLGVRESEHAVLAAITTLCETYASVILSLKLAADVGGDRVVLAAGEAAGARATLEGLFTALGVEDATGSVDKVASLMKQAGELEAAMPELAALREEKEKAEADAEETDVDEAIAASKFPGSLKSALLLERKKLGHDAFVLAFPAPEAPAAAAPVAAALAAGITAPVATSPAGTQLAVVGGKVVKLAAPQAAPASPTALPTGEGVIDVAMHSGANFTAKCRSYLSAEKAGFKDMAYDDQMTLTLNFKKQSHVVCSAGA